MGVQSIGMPVRREEDFRLLRGRAAMSTTSRRRPTSGRVWFWHLLLAITLVLVCLAQPRRRQPIILVISLLLQSDGARARRRALARRAGAVKMASSTG